jgi:hypothetical protein
MTFALTWISALSLSANRVTTMTRPVQMPSKVSPACR